MLIDTAAERDWSPQETGPLELLDVPGGERLSASEAAFLGAVLEGLIAATEAANVGEPVEWRRRMRSVIVDDMRPLLSVCRLGEFTATGLSPQRHQYGNM